MSEATQPESVSQDPTNGENQVVENTNSEHEEVDLDSLQKGLAKAMVLQWKSDHPEYSLDDVILSATKAAGSYSELLLEKGIDKTLYDQWRYVKYKLSMPKMVRDKKPVQIKLPERSNRQIFALQLKKEARQIQEENGNLQTYKKGDSENQLENGTSRVETKLNTTCDSKQVGDDRKSKNCEFKEKNEVKVETDKNSEFGNVSSDETAFDDGKATLAKIRKDLLEQKKQWESSTKQTDDGLTARGSPTFQKSIVSKIEPDKKKKEKIISTDGETISNNPLDVEKEKIPRVNKLNVEIPENNFEEFSFPCSDSIPQGTTKNLLDRWQNQRSEDVQKRKKRIVVVEDESKTEDAQPLESTQNAERTVAQDNLIENGSTEQLMNQLLSNTRMATEFFEKNSNEPISELSLQDDVEKFQIEKGFTKQLLNRWTSQESTFNVASSKTRIQLREEVGKNEPQIQENVKSGTSDENCIEKGFAKQLVDQWKNIPESKLQSFKTHVIISEQDGAIAENDPILREDVLKADSTIDPLEIVQKGTTKSLLQKWQNKTKEDFKESPKKVIIDEKDGHISENQPIERQDVIKADEIVEYANVKQGITKSLVSQWKNIKSEVNVNKTPIKIDEDQGHVAENQPIVRENVAKENDDVLSPTKIVQKGTTKALMNQWTENTSKKYISNRRSIIVEEDSGCVLENDPIVRDDVVKSIEIIPKVETVQKGIAKSLATKWNSGTITSAQQKNPEKKNIVVLEDDGHISENNPSPRKDNVYREEFYSEEANHLPTKGQTSLAKLKLISKTENNFVKREPIKMFESVHQQNSVAENEPVRREDVAREEDFCEEVIHKKGFAKNMVGFWNKPQHGDRLMDKKTVIELADGPSVFENTPEPSKLRRFENLCESGVFENQPIAREDVTREADCEPEVIPANVARNVRKLWFRKENEFAAASSKPLKNPELVRFTPPREKSPPQTIKEEYKSTHTVTLQSGKAD